MVTTPTGHPLSCPVRLTKRLVSTDSAYTSPRRQLCRLAVKVRCGAGHTRHCRWQYDVEWTAVGDDCCHHRPLASAELTVTGGGESTPAIPS